MQKLISRLGITSLFFFTATLSLAAEVEAPKSLDDPSLKCAPTELILLEAEEMKELEAIRDDVVNNYDRKCAAEDRPDAFIHCFSKSALDVDSFTTHRIGGYYLILKKMSRLESTRTKDPERTVYNFIFNAVETIGGIEPQKLTIESRNEAEYEPHGFKFTKAAEEDTLKTIKKKFKKECQLRLASLKKSLTKRKLASGSAPVTKVEIETLSALINDIK